MLEKGTDTERINALKQIITQSLNGDSMTALFMFVVKFIMPSKNKALKKLLLLYWEVNYIQYIDIK